MLFLVVFHIVPVVRETFVKLVIEIVAGKVKKQPLDTSTHT